MVSAMRPHHFRLLFELIGRDDIANDPDLQSHEDRIKNAAKIIKALQETMPTKTTEEWIAILQPKDVFCERVNNYTDYLDHPHVKESGAHRLDRAGRLWPHAGRQHPGPAAGLAARAQQHAPHTGENGPDILQELGYSAAEIDAMLSRGGVRAPATRAGAVTVPRTNQPGAMPPGTRVQPVSRSSRPENRADFTPTCPTLIIEGSRWRRNSPIWATAFILDHRTEAS